MAARRLLAAGLAHRSCEQRFDALAAGWSQGWAQAVAFSLRRHVARPANAGPEPCVDGLSPRLGPGAAYASMARPVTRARSLSCFSDIGSSRATWALSRLGSTGSSRSPGPEPFGDRPLLRLALGLRVFGPYFALGRDLATFALGEVPMTGLPLLCAGPPRLDGSSHSLGARSRVRDRPLLRRAHDPRVCGPYFALGRDLATWIWAPSLWLAVPYFALVRPAWLVQYPGPGAWLVPYPGPGALILPCEAETCPFMMGA